MSGPVLVDVPTVARLLDVSPQRIHQLLRDHPDWPAPYAVVGNRRLWSRADIAVFAAATGRTIQEAGR